MIDSPLISPASVGTPIANWVGGAGLGIAGGYMYTSLYAASSVYEGGPGAVTNVVVVGKTAPSAVAPAPGFVGSMVVWPKKP